MMNGAGFSLLFAVCGGIFASSSLTHSHSHFGWTNFAGVARWLGDVGVRIFTSTPNSRRGHIPPTLTTLFQIRKLAGNREMRTATTTTASKRFYESCYIVLYDENKIIYEHESRIIAKIISRRNR